MKMTHKTLILCGAYFIWLGIMVMLDGVGRESALIISQIYLAVAILSHSPKGTDNANS